MTTRSPVSASVKKTPAGVEATVKLSKQASDLMGKIGSMLWSKECPFASLFVYMMILKTVYYLFLMPEVTVNLKDDKVHAEKVSQSLRSWLVLATVVSGLIGWFLIKRGCDEARPYMGFVWFLVALVLNMFISRILLASIDRITLAQASEILKQSG